MLIEYDQVKRESQEVTGFFTKESKENKNKFHPKHT